MHAKAKLQNLSYSWYGYTFISTIASILNLRASGMASLVFGVVVWAVFAAISLAIGLALVTWVSRSLLGRSALMRRAMIVLSALGVVGGGLGILSLVGAFFHEWSLWILLQIALTGAWALLNFRSLRTLTETSVKAYFV